MIGVVRKWFNNKIPKNYILKNPLAGTLILLGFLFAFAVLYKPLHVHGARSFSIELTMILYMSILFFPVSGCLFLLKRIPYFSKESDWTLIKELVSILIVLIVTGIAVYFAGFIVETPSDRWNLSTFIGSLITASGIVILPFVFFTISNYRYLFSEDILQYYNLSGNKASPSRSEEPVHISSQLKKEELSFCPSQFLYAESDGNYVVFHLQADGQHLKKTIRNSINEVEQQMSVIPGIMRIHRAFIVNLGKIISKEGNALGYRLKLSGVDSEIPVSRNNTKNFDIRMKQFS